MQEGTLKITPEPPAEESKTSRPGRNLPVITKDVIQLYNCSSFRGKQTMEYGEPSELEFASRNDAFLAKEGGTTGVPLVPVLDEGFFIDLT
jgi:hypothetical protein